MFTRALNINRFKTVFQRGPKYSKEYTHIKDIMDYFDIKKHNSMYILPISFIKTSFH